MTLSIGRLLLAVAITGALTSPVSASPRLALQLDCTACLVVDEEGTPLFARQPRLELPNASTTKMVTALLVVQTARLDEVVTVSRAAAATGGGTLDLQPGDRLTVHDLLYALLLASSNDAAIALAEHVAGSEARFVRLMNRYATRRGLSDTRFVTPHGLDRPGHYSSARDLARIAAEVLEDPVLAPVVASPRARIRRNQRPERVENRNLLLESYRGAAGVKTGYTAAAGNVLVAAARRGGRRVVSVVIGSDDSFRDTRLLLNDAFRRLRRALLVTRAAVVGALLHDSAGSVPVTAAAALRGSARPDTVEVRFRAASDVALPVAAGDPVGVVEVVVEGEVVGEVPAVAAGALGSATEPWPERMLAGILRVFGGLTRTA